MNCEIIWQNQAVGAPPSKNVSLLQYAPYIAALTDTSKFKPRSGTIMVNAQVAGSVRIMEIKTLAGLIHGVTLDRGPIWLEGFGGAHHIKAFFDEFNRQFPTRLGRKRRIIPEIEDGLAARKMLESTGLQRVGEGYQTYLLDLAKAQDDLRASLQQKWRNVLNRAERDKSASVEWDLQARQLPWFLKVYTQDKMRKNYEGPSVDLLRALAQQMSSTQDLIVGRFMQEGSAIGAILVACHGNQATYLAGWSGEAGRAAGAHHRLLWELLTVLQEKGIRTFDLGGFNEQDAKGIKDFKEGMGGRVYRLAGRYI